VRHLPIYGTFLPELINLILQETQARAIGRLMILWLKKKPIEPEERSQEALARICEEYGFRDETDPEQFARLFNARQFLEKAEFLSRMMPLGV